jgi:hypothetical protein
MSHLSLQEEDRKEPFAYRFQAPDGFKQVARLFRLGKEAVRYDIVADSPVFSPSFPVPSLYTFVRALFLLSLLALNTLLPLSCSVFVYVCGSVRVDVCRCVGVSVSVFFICLCVCGFVCACVCL